MIFITTSSGDHLEHEHDKVSQCECVSVNDSSQWIVEFKESNSESNITNYYVNDNKL